MSDKEYNFIVDWSAEPTICILCGNKESCNCEKLTCDRCKNVALNCVCFDETCEKCNKLFFIECSCNEKKA